MTISYCKLLFNLNPLNMNLSFSQLPEPEQTLLRRIGTAIFQSINPDYLFCYGSRSSIHYSRSCFGGTEKASQYERQYDLAVIVSEQEPRPDEKLVLLAKKAGSCCDHTNIIVHRRDTVTRLLQEGDFFFLRLFTHAIPLHEPRPAPVNLSIMQLVAKQQALPPATAARARQLLQSGGQLAYDAAKAQEEGHTAKALYLVSQSVQASLRAMLLACTGWVPAGAGLYALLNHSCNVTREAAAIFPRNTREKAGLFGLIARTPGNTLRAMGIGAAVMDSLVQRAVRMNEVAREVMKEVVKMEEVPVGRVACA